MKFQLPLCLLPSVDLQEGCGGEPHDSVCDSMYFKSHKRHTLGSEIGLLIDTAWRWISLLIWPCVFTRFLSFLAVSLGYFCDGLLCLHRDCFISALHCTLVLLCLSFLFCPLVLSFSVLVVARGCICQERSKYPLLCIGNRAVIHFCCVYTAA